MSGPRTLLQRITREPETMPDGKPRQRCRTCRRFFDWTIIDGRYCRPECAGVDPDTWGEACADERAHRVRYDDCRAHTWRRKRIYLDDEQASIDAARLAEETGLPYATYTCRLGNLHVGHRIGGTP